MRNNSLDTFRFFAAFAVILLHVNYGNLPAVAENNIRLLGRFAVPFFFMVSGYFFYQNFQRNGDGSFVKSLQRLIGVFIIACSVYLLLKFKKLSFTFSILFDGTNSHLWFLSSMIFGLIVCWYHYSYSKSRLVMSLASSIIILLFLLSDPYAGMLPLKLDVGFCRYLISVPFIYLGTLIAERKYSLSNKTSMTLIVSGIVLQILESLFVYRYYAYDTFTHQFYIGTILFSVGMFFLSFNGFQNTYLAELGRKYSLSIYIYHKFVNFFVFKAIAFIFKGFAVSIFIFSPVISFCCTLAFLVVVEKHFPVLFAILNGEIKMISKLFSRRPLLKLT